MAGARFRWQVRAEWKERLASMTAERDRMLWRMEHAKKTQTDDYARIDALAKASKHREAAIPALGSGLVRACLLHLLDRWSHSHCHTCRW